MSLVSRVSGFGKTPSQLAGAVAKLLRRFDRNRRLADDSELAGRNRGLVAPAKPETRDPKPETFFDTDFLRKLERLHVVAKRLSWAGAKGEHAASRKGFSLEFTTTGAINTATTCATSTGIFRRLERLLLKVFTSEEELNIYLLVDTSRSMAEESAGQARLRQENRRGAGLHRP